MKSSEAKKLASILKAAYPRQPIDTTTLDVYASFLSDLDVSAATLAVKRIVSSSRFFPTVAEIREAVAEHECGLPSVQAAVEQVMGRYSLPVSDRPKLAPEVRRAIEAVGGEWAIKHSDNPGVIRAQLRDAYAEIRREALRQVQERPAMPPAEKLAAIEAPATPLPELRAMT
jgi:hypothetical protein